MKRDALATIAVAAIAVAIGTAPIYAGGVWPGDAHAASIDQQLGLARQQVYEAEHSPSADLQALRSKLQVARKKVDEVLIQHPQHTQALALAARIDTLLKQLAPPALGGHPYEKEAEVTADRLAGLIKSGGKRTEIESLHTHLRKLIQRLPREKSSMAAAYKARAQALWQLYKPSLVRVTDACAKCPALNLATLVPEYTRPRLLGTGDYTLLDLKEMGKQGYATLVTGDFNRDGRNDIALVGKNEQDTGSELFFLIVGLDNKGGYRRLLFEKPEWNKAALAGYKGKLTLGYVTLNS